MVADENNGGIVLTSIVIGGLHLGGKEAATILHVQLFETLLSSLKSTPGIPSRVVFSPPTTPSVQLNCNSLRWFQ